MQRLSLLTSLLIWSEASYRARELYRGGGLAFYFAKLKSIANIFGKRNARTITLECAKMGATMVVSSRKVASSSLYFYDYNFGQAERS